MLGLGEEQDQLRVRFLEEFTDVSLGCFHLETELHLTWMAVNTDDSSCLHYFLATWFPYLPVKLSKLLSSVLFRGTVDYYLYPNDKIIAGSMFSRSRPKSQRCKAEHPAWKARRSYSSMLRDSVLDPLYSSSTQICACMCIAVCLIFPQECVNYLGAPTHRSKEPQNHGWKEISAVEIFQVVSSPK